MGSNPQDQNPGLNSRNAEYIRGKPNCGIGCPATLAPSALGP